MERLEWNVQYSVGIADIDRQHAYLFELGNRLAKHVGDADDTILRDTIKELHLYVERHFALEESIMEKAGYEHLAEHRKMHDLMCIRLDLMTAQLKQGMLTRQDLTEFLQTWLTEHIIMEDMRYIPAVSKLNL